MKALALLILPAFASVALAEDITSIVAPLRPETTAAIASLQAASPGAVATRQAQPNVLDERSVLAALEGELTKQLNLDGELRLTFTRPWVAVKLTSEEPWDLRITEAPAGGLSSATLVRFSVQAGERKIGEWQTLVRAQLFKPVWVANRRLDRGQNIDASYCTVQTVDVIREKQALVPAETNLDLYELSQTVSPERALAWRDIALKPCIRKGDKVEVIIKEGLMNISMKAVAMSNGAVGEAILIRNLDTRKDFSAKVTAPNTVQVAF